MQRVASVFPPRWNRRARALGARRRGHRARSRRRRRRGPTRSPRGRDTHVVAQKLRDGPIMVLAKRVDEPREVRLDPPVRRVFALWVHAVGAHNRRDGLPVFLDELIERERTPAHVRARRFVVRCRLRVTHAFSPRPCRRRPRPGRYRFRYRERYRNSVSKSIPKAVSVTSGRVTRSRTNSGASHVGTTRDR